ncbi:MAG: VOC family protein [Rhodobacteraceae bacterium]|nr:VOC family protein [Paracoccaceae bacterium]
MVGLRSIDHFVLTVRDVTETVAFYGKALGMVAEQFTPADGSSRWALKFGHCKINLHAEGAEFKPHAQQPVSGSADVCLLTDDPLAAWQAHLAAQGVAIEQGPIARTGARGPIQSIYIRDPDGNLIEISTYG